MDRTKEPGALGEPLYMDVINALCAGRAATASPWSAAATAWARRTPRRPRVFAVYDRAGEGRARRRDFTVGIVDDVTNLSLPEDPDRPNTAAEGTIECKFWGLGGDGTVGANKNSIKIIGDHTDKYVQAYFQYDSKKTGGVTISHLRFGDTPIQQPLLHQQGRLRGLPQPLLRDQGLHAWSTT